MVDSDGDWGFTTDFGGDSHGMANSLADDMIRGPAKPLYEIQATLGGSGIASGVGIMKFESQGLVDIYAKAYKTIVSQAHEIKNLSVLKMLQNA